MMRKLMLPASLQVMALFGVMMAPASASVGYPEKEELKFGFIKLTDMAPLAVAYEKGFLKTKDCLSI